MDNGKNRPADHLGINRISRNIRKTSPLHAQAFANPSLLQNQPQNQIQPPQPQVYNISKNDFRSVVQQLTGTPTRDPFPAAPAAPTVPPRPKVPSMRLQKIRPPPLNPIARPPIPHPAHANPSFYPRHAAPPPTQVPAAPANGPFWRPNLESPTSAYMRYLESSIINGGGTPQTQAPPPQQQVAPLASGLLPTPTSSGLLPSPSTQLFMTSPTAFMNLSPFPVFSPKFQFPPLSPSFQFSPLPGQMGILGPGPPGSPLFFPSSPSGFLMSPRWRDL